MFNSSLGSDSGSRLIQNQFAFNSSLGSNICSILFLEIHVRVNSSFVVNSLELLACNFFEWVSLAYPFRTYSRAIRHIRVRSDIFACDQNIFACDQNIFASIFSNQVHTSRATLITSSHHFHVVKS